jgi:PAS domain S-box-containing protein
MTDQIRRLTGEMQQEERTLLIERAARSQVSARTVVSLIALGSLLSLLTVSVSLLMVNLDMSKRKRAENALRDSEEKYRVLYESSREAIMMLAPPEWEFTAGNPAAIALFGAKDEREFVAEAPWRLSPEYQPDGELSSVKARQMIDAAMERGSHFFEWTHKKFSGEEFFATVTLTRMIYRGQPLLQATFRDITERKRAEAEMAERHRLETLVAEVGVALTGAESLRQGLQQCAEIMVRDINAAFARIWTVNEEDKVLELQVSAGMYTHLDGGHARVPMGQFKIGRIAENGEPHLTNTVQQDPWVGDPEWARREGMVAFAGYPLRVGEDVLGVVAAFARQPLAPATLQAFASVAHNLAQFIKRKRAEEALRESEEKYRALIETTGTGYVIIDTQGSVIDANPEYVRLTGRRALHEILGRRVTEWTAQHDLARNAEAVRRCAELGFVRNLELEYVNGDGKCTPIEVNATVVPAAGGVRIVSLCRDITERKRAEQALRESEERYRLLFERNLAGVFRGTLLSQRILDCNVAYARILGYDSRQEALSRGKLRDFYEPAEFETAKARLLNEKVLTNFEVRLRRKDQTPVWVLANVSLIEAGEAEESLVAGTLIDITERKQAEQALAQERGLLRALMDNLPDHIYFKDRQSRFLRTNMALAKAFRLSDPGQAVGKTDFDFFTAEHAQQAYSDEQEVVTTGKPMTAKEEKETWPDGRVTWVSTTKVPFRDANGAIIGTFGVSRDITERKRAEKALEERTTYLNTLIDISPLGIVVLDTEERVQMSNPAFEKLFLYSRREMQGVNLDELIIPRELVSEAEGFAKRCLRGGSVHATSRRRRKDGTLVDLEIYAVPLVMEGKPRGILALYQDITERKHAEEALRASEERYRELFENASDLVYTTDLEGGLTSLNRVAEQTLAYSREEAAQMNFRQLVDPRHWQRVEQTRERLLAGDSAVTLELEITAKDGRRVMLEVNPRLIYKDGKPVGMQGIGRDITGRDEREMELRHAQKLESVGRLASGIAHEINTPIQFVGDNTRFVQDSFGGLQTLLSKYQELRAAAASGTVSPDLLAAVRRVEEESDCAYLLEEIPKALTQTLDGVTRVATLVRAMKDFAHPESKEKAAADLNKALLSTLTVARNELKYVADVETDLGDLPPVVCNISDLNQVFLNLLVNAAHAISEVMKGSGEKGKIRVRTVAEDNTVLVTIADTGCGIPEGIRTKVFDPFFTTKEVGRGTGQGLAIARSVVVERHKGTLTFESEVGKGTSFYVRLPVESEEYSEKTRVP